MKWMYVFLGACLVGTVHAELTVTAGALKVMAEGDQIAILNGSTRVMSTRLEGEVFACERVRSALGEGDALVSKKWTIAVYPQQPFVFFQQVLTPGCAGVTNRVFYPEIVVHPAVNALLTSGGLQTLEKNPGSYMWTALADAKSRAGVVAGWVTIDRGSGIVRTRQQTLLPHVDYGRLMLKTGQREALEVFAVGYFEDARLGLEAYADVIAKNYAIHLPPMPTVHCTWYVDGASTQAKLGPRSEFAEQALAPFGLNVVQIDDGWQLGAKTNGPRKVFIDYDPKGPYPDGMKAMADTIRAHHFVAGLWLIPFAGTYSDPWFADKQHWFAKRPDGKPYDTFWGGTCFDLTHPDVKHYVRDVIDTIVHKWGYRYLKMDGLYTGAAINLNYVCDTFREDEAGQSVLFNPDVTQFQMMRESLQLVRDTAGKETFLLGCCTPQNMRSAGLAFGRVDAMRIGPDNGANWNTILRGPEFGAWHYFLHGRVWYNDPDPLYVRIEPSMHSKVICSWVALSGQMNSSSEEYAKLKPAQLDLLKRTMPAHRGIARPVDLFEKRIPEIWTVTFAGRTVIGLFNWESREQTLESALTRLGLAEREKYIAFEYWNDGLTPLFTGTLTRTLAPQSCEVVSICKIKDHPQVISTSRHITQGMVDLSQEQWTDEHHVLSGTSAVIGGDAYELRVLIETSRGAMKPLSVQHNGTDVTVKEQVEEGLYRVTFQSAKTQDIRWKIEFSPTERVVIEPRAWALKATQGTVFEPLTLSWQSNVRCEITRNGKVVHATYMGKTWIDETIQSENTYTYGVTPVSLSGIRGTTQTVTYSVPRIPQLGAVPPQPEITLASLKPVKFWSEYGGLHVNKALNGPLTLGTNVYVSGICIHAEGYAVYARDKTWKRFVAVVGIDESQRRQKQSSVSFAVAVGAADGERIIALSPVLRFGQREVWYFDVAIPDDAKTIKVMSQSAGDGNKSDHGNWCDAGFLSR